MKRIVDLVCAMALFLSSAAHAGQLIDFDNLVGLPAPAADNFQSQGVVFEDLGLADVSGVTYYSSGAGSSVVTLPNIGSLSTALGFSLAATVRFVDPGSGFPATTDFIEFDVFDTEVGTSGIVVTAYDVDDNVLHSQDYITPGATFFMVTLAIPEMHRLELESDPDGNGIDNFRFNDVLPLVSVPTTHPFAVVVLAAGLVLSAAWTLQSRVRRRSL